MDTKLNNKLPFVNTIRFKLTFLYSSLLFLFAGSLVIIFNVYLGTYLRHDPDPHMVQLVPFPVQGVVIFDDFSQLQSEERARIRNIRLNDLQRIQRISTYSLIPLAVASFALGYFMSGRYLDPLARLKREIESMESKNLGTVLPLTSDDEVGVLIASFNDLSTRLKLAFQSQEQFVQDASHELRTPLTVIQTNLDTVLDNPQASKEELSLAISNSLQGVKQLRKLVNYLLQLTTLHTTPLVPVDLKNVVEAQINTLDNVMKEKKLEIFFDKKNIKTAKIMGDEMLLGRVVTNLLENAIKYSTRKDDKTVPIVVSITDQDRDYSLNVTNHGDTITSEKLQKLFDRFYQADPSRNKKLGGYGLGLSIVKKVAEELGGKVSAIYKDETYTFLLILPKAK